MKGKMLRKKLFVHSEKPKKDSCSGLPKDFTEILAMRAREQTEVISFCNKKVPSFLASVQSDNLTSKLFIYLFNSFTAINQHSEGIKQDVPYSFRTAV